MAPSKQKRIPVGTMVELRCGDEKEFAVLVRPRAENLPLPSDQWYIVQFTDNGKLCVHRNNFLRVFPE